MIEVITFFAGWIIGASVREHRIKRKANELAASMAKEAAINFANKQLVKYDNALLRAMWEGQKGYLRVMINAADSGISIQDMKRMFEMQVDMVDQEIAVENTKQLLL